MQCWRPRHKRKEAHSAGLDTQTTILLTTNAPQWVVAHDPADLEKKLLDALFAFALPPANHASATAIFRRGLTSAPNVPTISTASWDTIRSIRK